MSQDLPRPITEHLTELRSRLFWVLGAWGISFLAAFSFKEKVFEILLWPALRELLRAGRQMSALSPPELFMSYIKASLLAGFLVSVPMTLYQGWAFISPGLYSNEKRLAVPFVLVTTLLFLIGNLFGYFVAFPFVFEFFLELENEYVTMYWSTQAVFGFMSRLYLAFGLSFELPIIMFFLSLAGIVNPSQMARARPYAVVGMFIVGAVLTPPDVISQVALAGPLVLLYELGLLASKISARKRESQQNPIEA